MSKLHASCPKDGDDRAVYKVKHAFLLEAAQPAIVCGSARVSIAHVDCTVYVHAPYALLGRIGQGRAQRFPEVGPAYSEVYVVCGGRPVGFAIRAGVANECARAVFGEVFDCVRYG